MIICSVNIQKKKKKKKSLTTPIYVSIALLVTNILASGMFSISSIFFV